MPNGAKWYDNTLKKEGIELEDVIKFLENQPDIDRWCFEPETGEETGYEHYQIRYVLKSKSTLTAEIDRWRAYFGADHIHVSVLGMKHPNWEYVQKEGNYIASWEYKSPIKKYANFSLRNWQGEVVAELMDQDDRCITVIVDQTGGIGKSTLGKILEARGISDYCPVNSTDAGEYVAYCFEFEHKGYTFDLPRADTIRTKKQMWMAIEMIKNGCLYEKRYCPRKKWIEPPKILVFTNDYPDPFVLSADRWRVYRINDVWGAESLERVSYKELVEIQDRFEESCLLRK